MLNCPETQQFWKLGCEVASNSSDSEESSRTGVSAASGTLGKRPPGINLTGWHQAFVTMVVYDVLGSLRFPGSVLPVLMTVFHSKNWVCTIGTVLKQMAVPSSPLLYTTCKSWKCWNMKMLCIEAVIWSILLNPFVGINIPKLPKIKLWVKNHHNLCLVMIGRSLNTALFWLAETVLRKGVWWPRLSSASEWNCLFM